MSKKSFYKYTFHLPDESLDELFRICNLYHKSEKDTTGNTYNRFVIRYMFILDFVNRHQYSKSDYVTLSRNWLASTIGVSNSVATVMLNNLLSSGLLIKVKHHIAPNSSKGTLGTSTGYQVKFTDNTELVTEESNAKFIQKIIEKRNSRLDEEFKSTLEGQLYYNYISNIYIDNNNIQYIHNNITNIISFRGKYQKKVCLNAIRAIFRIQEKDFICRRPDNRRVICNLSILPRELRKFLRFDGKAMKGLDIRNSQPLIAGTLIKRDFYGIDSNLDLEIDDYIKLCEDGKFYEEFMTEDYNKTEDLRKEFKKKFFRDNFFSKVPKKNKRQLRKLFEKRFPLISGIIDRMKGKEGTREYAEFSKKLQLLESNIIFDGVNVPLLKRGLQCFNIYDSIVSHDDKVLEEARKLIYQEFAKYGVKPTINIENY